MKMLIVGLLALASLSAFAHPKDTDDDDVISSCTIRERTVYCGDSDNTARLFGCEAACKEGFVATCKRGSCGCGVVGVTYGIFRDHRDCKVDVTIKEDSCYCKKVKSK